MLVRDLSEFTEPFQWEEVIEDFAIVRWGVIPKGFSVMGHAHNEHHLMIFFQGGARLTAWKELVDGGFEKIRQEEIWAANASKQAPTVPLVRMIKKEIHHEFVALETLLYGCFFAFRDPLSGKVVETWNGNMKAAYAKGA